MNLRDILFEFVQSLILILQNQKNDYAIGMCALPVELIDSNFSTNLEKWVIFARIEPRSAANVFAYMIEAIAQEEQGNNLNGVLLIAIWSSDRCQCISGCCDVIFEQLPI